MYFKGSQVKFSKLCTFVFLYLKVVLILANSADHDDNVYIYIYMLHFIWVFTVCQSTRLGVSSILKVILCVKNPF